MGTATWGFDVRACPVPPGALPPPPRPPPQPTSVLGPCPVPPSWTCFLCVVAARTRRLRVDVAGGQLRRADAELVKVVVWRVGQDPRGAIHHLPGVLPAKQLDGRVHHRLEPVVDALDRRLVQSDLEQIHHKLPERDPHDVGGLFRCQLPPHEAIKQLLKLAEEPVELKVACAARRGRVAEVRAGPGSGARAS